jgi:4-oxalomesaconate tautomerase
MSVEHPTGEFTVNLTVGGTAAKPVIERAGLLRTARKLFEGKTFAHLSARAAAPKQAAE